MITSVRPYFKSIMKDLGFDEWRKSLEADNFPKALLKSVYHLKTGSISGGKQNQRDIEVSVPITVTFAKKGGRDEVSAYELAEQTIQDIVKEVLAPANKASATGVVSIAFVSADPEAISASNDNVLLSRVNFSCTVILGV